jgi:two-component system invasion response regulator UvrY
VAISLSLALPRPAEAEPSSGPVQAARVLLVDDHKIVREGLRSLLESQPDVEVVGESVSGEEAIELTRQLEPDVVLMDVSLPHVSGIEATRRLTEQVPSAKVIALSVHEAADVASAMYAAGAVSYVSKAGPGDELLRAVRRVRSMS